MENKILSRKKTFISFSYIYNLKIYILTSSYIMYVKLVTFKAVEHIKFFKFKLANASFYFCNKVQIP